MPGHVPFSLFVLTSIIFFLLLLPLLFSRLEHTAKMHSVVKDLFVHTLFYLALMVIIYSGANSNAFQLAESVRQTMLHAGKADHAPSHFATQESDFVQIANEADYWDWVSSPQMPSRAPLCFVRCVAGL